MIPEAALLSFMATLFSMMNPIGNVGVFAGMTADLSASECRKIAWNCAVSVAITLMIVVWAGPQLLGFFGVTVDMGGYEFQADACAADVNGDGAVDVNDLLLLLSGWGACP